MGSVIYLLLGEFPPFILVFDHETLESIWITHVENCL